MEGSYVERSLKREILSRGYIILLKLFLGISFKDAQCGFKAIRKEAAEKLLVKVKDNEFFFDSELMIKAQREGYKIKEIPIRWIEDQDSRVNIPNTVKNYIFSMLRLRWEFFRHLFQ